MKAIIISCISASLIFLIIDAIWLSITIKLFYKPNLGALLNDKPIIWPAILFYLIYPVGLTLIIIKPTLYNYDFLQAFWTGIIFGIVAYGTYNLTNMSTIKNWSTSVVFVDMFWGGLLSGITATTSLYVTRYILKFG